MTRWRRIAAALLLAPLLAACGVKPVNDYALPGGTANGGDGYSVTAVFDDIGNLVSNSAVQYHDVTIGTVRSISVRNWKSRVTLRLLKDVALPANVTVKVGQKSLLGAQYVEIADPARPVGALRAGDVIRNDRTGAYPETEQVLSAVALLLNNGGLPQLKTIATEVDTVIHGSAAQQSVRDLVDDLTTFVNGLDAQKQQIINTISAVDRLASTLAEQRAELASAIDRIEPGLKVLNGQRTSLVKALEALGEFGQVGSRVIKEAGGGLADNLANLQPVLTNLAAAGDALPQSLRFILTYPWPLKNLNRVFRGDYANIAVTLDMTLGNLANNFLGTLPTAGSPALDAQNPVLAPLHTKPAGAAPAGDAAAGATDAAKTPSSGVTSAAARPAPSASATSAPATGGTSACSLLQALLGGC